MVAGLHQRRVCVPSGPVEHFQIKWRQAYPKGLIDPSDWNKVNASVCLYNLFKGGLKLQLLVIL